MTFFIVAVISIIAFCVGFLLGSFNSPPKVKENKIRYEIENEQLAKEYRNFLSYDGTEQF